MADNKGIMLLAVGAAAYYFFLRKGGPTFRNMQGQAIDQISCGNSVTFDVPGYTQIWLQRLKDGNLDFNQAFALPMPPYVMNCATDIGVYDIAAYEIDPDTGAKGNLIGQTKFTVVPQS